MLAVRGRPSDGLRQCGLLVTATIHVVIAGYVLAKYIDSPLRGAEVVAWATLGFGILLWLVDLTAMTVRQI